MSSPSFPFETSPPERHRALWTALGVTVTTGIVSVAVAFISSQSSQTAIALQTRSSDAATERQRQQDYVKIAVGILREKPGNKDQGFTDGERALREWAVDIVNLNADPDITKEARTALVEGIASFGGWSGWGGDAPTYEYTLTPHYSDGSSGEPVRISEAEWQSIEARKKDRKVTLPDKGE